MVEPSSLQVGQFVCVRNPETKKVLVCKVTQVKDSIMHYTIYAKPEDLPGRQRQPHHSKFELIRTDEVGKEFVENIVKRQVNVLRLQDFKSRFPTPQSLQSLLEGHGGPESEFQSDFYFFRQRFIGKLNMADDAAENQKSKLMPELKPICVCQKILNVEDETEECPECKAFFHPICMRQHSDRRCFECKEELPKKLVYTHKREITTGQDTQDKELAGDGTPMKRAKLADENPVLNDNQQGSRPIVSQTASSTNREAYPSLRAFPALSRSLDSIVTSYKRINEHTLASMPSETQQLKTRKNVKENFTQSLMLGVAEALARIKAVDQADHLSEDRQLVARMTGQTLDSLSLPDFDERAAMELFWQQARKACMDYATQIESGMYIFYENTISRDYGRKFRQLQTSLRNDDNSELRSMVLMEKIVAFEVTQLTPDQLAPRSKKEQIEQTKRANFEQRVITADKDQGIGTLVKTSSGLEFVENEVKEANTQKTDNEEDVKQTQNEKEASPVATKKFRGMTDEAQALYDDLDKWSFASMHAKFEKRIAEYLRTNSVTRDTMLTDLTKLQAQYAGPSK